MIIINLPVPLRINCECGCDFIFDMEDLNVREMYVDNYTVKWITVDCPFCHKTHTLKKIDSMKGDENE